MYERQVCVHEARKRSKSLRKSRESVCVRARERSKCVREMRECIRKRIKCEREGSANVCEVEKHVCAGERTQKCLYEREIREKRVCVCERGI